MNLTMHNPSDLFEALAFFQAEVGAVEKAGYNPFHESKYATLKNVVDTVRPLLEKHRLVITQFPDDDGLTTILSHHGTGGYIMAHAKLVAPKNPQVQGSAITYMRRYAISAILGLVTEADDDGESAMNRLDDAKKRTTPKWKK